LLGGQDVLAILPTGGGKSLVFQLTSQPRLGITLVVSPLLIAQTKGSLRLISGGLFGNEAPATLSATSRSTERRYNVYLLLEFQARNQEAPIYLLQFERLIDL
jgi:ATP-dependent DNA helicase RecQ